MTGRPTAENWMKKYRHTVRKERQQYPIGKYVMRTIQKEVKMNIGNKRFKEGRMGLKGWWDRGGSSMEQQEKREQEAERPGQNGEEA